MHMNLLFYYNAGQQGLERQKRPWSLKKVEVVFKLCDLDVIHPVLEAIPNNVTVGKDSAIS